MNDERRYISGYASDAASLTHVGSGVSKVDRTNRQLAGVAQCFVLFAHVAKRLVVLEPFHLIKPAIALSRKSISVRAADRLKTIEYVLNPILREGDSCRWMHSPWGKVRRLRGISFDSARPVYAIGCEA